LYVAIYALVADLHKENFTYVSINSAKLYAIIVEYQETETDTLRTVHNNCNATVVTTGKELNMCETHYY